MDRDEEILEHATGHTWSIQKSVGRKNQVFLKINQRSN